jgi:hypothetical protein
MTGVRKSGRGGMQAPREHEPARSTITDGRMTPCHKAVSIAKERPKAEAVSSS